MIVRITKKSIFKYKRKNENKIKKEMDSLFSNHSDKVNVFALIVIFIALPFFVNAQVPNQTSQSEPTQEEILASLASPNPNCTAKWTCSEWGACIGEMQSRTCYISNQCSIGSQKPNETMPCQEVKTIQNQESIPNKVYQNNLDKAKLFVKNYYLIIISSSVVFIIILLIVFKSKKPSDRYMDEFGYSEDKVKAIASYIIKTTRSGYAEGQIKQKLIEAGHDIKKIEKIIEHLNKKR